MQEQIVKGVCLNVDSDPYGIFMFAINSQVKWKNTSVVVCH